MISYEILGLNRDTADDDIHSADRRLALQFRPDRNDAPDAENMTDVLNDRNRKLADGSVGNGGTPPTMGGRTPAGSR